MKSFARVIPFIYFYDGIVIEFEYLPPIYPISILSVSAELHDYKKRKDYPMWVNTISRRSFRTWCCISSTTWNLLGSWTTFTTGDFVMGSTQFVCRWTLVVENKLPIIMWVSIYLFCVSISRTMAALPSF